MKQYDVAIIGYGPTGALMAYLLGRQGLSTLVVEPNLDIYKIPRAVHYDGEAMRIFQSLGMIDEIRESSREPGSASFLNGFNWKIFHQDLSKSDRVHHWANSHFFSQPELEKLLRGRVNQCASVDHKLGWRLKDVDQDSNGVTIRIAEHEGQQTEAYRCSYLLGCDGAASSTRELANIPLTDLGCDEPWLVCDLMLEKSTEIKDEIYQICDPARPTSLIPCEPGHIRWEFMLNESDDPHEIEVEENVRALMAPYIARLNSQLTKDDGKLIRSKIYRFHALLADQFKRGRVLLLGDAAHQMPPFLGQGLCSGLRDTYNLSWKLGGVIRNQWDPKVLESYQSERQPHVEEVINLAIQHGEIIQTRNPLKATVRDLFLLLGRLFPPLIASIKFGQQWRLGKGIFSKDSLPLNRFMLRQCIITREHGEPALLDDLLSDSFNLVGFDTDVDSLVSKHNIDFLGAPLKTFNIGVHGQGIDETGTLQCWADDNQIAIALLRPDKQIYGLCYQNNAQSLSEQLADLLGQLKTQLI